MESFFDSITDIASINSISGDVLQSCLRCHGTFYFCNRSGNRLFDKGLRTFSWSCFLYGQPLACSVFYRAFPAQRLFDPRMVVPVDVFAGEVDDLLARAFLPMPGDARTRSFIRPKNPLSFVKSRWTCSAVDLDTVGVQVGRYGRLVEYS